MPHATTTHPPAIQALQATKLAFLSLLSLLLCFSPLNGLTFPLISKSLLMPPAHNIMIPLASSIVPINIVSQFWQLTSCFYHSPGLTLDIFSIPVATQDIFSLPHHNPRFTQISPLGEQGRRCWQIGSYHESSLVRCSPRVLGLARSNLLNNTFCSKPLPTTNRLLKFTISTLKKEWYPLLARNDPELLDWYSNLSNTKPLWPVESDQPKRFYTKYSLPVVTLCCHFTTLE